MGRGAGLLDFPMQLMLAAIRAELLKLDPLRSGFLVLSLGIIPVFALSALKRNDIARHIFLPTFGMERNRSPQARELEPLTGIEPVTSSLPRTRSTN